MQGSTRLHRVGFVVRFLGAGACGRFEGVGEGLKDAEGVVGAAAVVGHFCCLRGDWMGRWVELRGWIGSAGYG